MSDADPRPITLVLTIQPLDKKNRRRVDVLGAPAGEMPLVASGSFAERHQLVDRVYGELLRRKPQALKGAAAKDQAAPEDEPDKAPDAESPAQETPAADQIGPPEPATEVSTETLPAIEGDDAPAATDGEGDDE